MDNSFYKTCLLFIIVSFIPFRIFATDDSVIAKNKAEFYSLKDVYRLKEVNAVDYKGKLSADAMKKFSDEAKGEFNSKDFAFNATSNTLYICSRSSTFYKVLKLEKNGKYLIYSRCNTCDPLEFVIKSMSDSVLILDIDSPDSEGFMFEYIFYK